MREENQQKKLYSVALLVVADGHFVSSGVAKSRSHVKGEEYLTATRRRASSRRTMLVLSQHIFNFFS